MRIKKVDARTGIVEITSVDARNGSWLLDIKPYIPANERVLNAKNRRLDGQLPRPLGGAQASEDGTCS